MSDQTTAADATDRAVQAADGTDWRRLADADPIRIRDPLAELLGMVPDGEALVVRFADVATAAGHVCPAVAGAYRGTQLALAELYPDETPVRTDVAVRVGGDPSAPGFGPMANVIRHVTGAADETGFGGLAGVGGRDDLLTFGEVPGPGRSFAFTRLATDDTVQVSFDPSAVGGGSDGSAGPPIEVLSKLANGDLPAHKREQFYDQWYGCVQRILDAEPGEDGPFDLRRP